MAKTVRELALNQAFVDLTDSLVSKFDAAELLQHLVKLVTELLSTDAASVLLSDAEGEWQVAASTADAAHHLELYQLQSGQGPSLTCFNSGRPVSVPDLDAASERWPLFVPTAHELGYAAVHALPMRVRNEVIGALSLFSVKRGALPESDRSAAQALADLATVGILLERASRQRERIVEQTQEMVHSRFVVEQAKGMLAASGVGMEEAYDLLRHYSGYRDSRLVEVASDLAAGRVEPSVVIAAGTLAGP